PSALSAPALATVRLALHPPLGCGHSRPASSEPNSIGYFANGARLREFCAGSDRNKRLECEGYIRAVTDGLLTTLTDLLPRPLLNICAPTWQTPDQAVSATIVFLNGHPEQGETTPAPTLIAAALVPPSCPLAPVPTQSVSVRPEAPP